MGFIFNTRSSKRRTMSIKSVVYSAKQELKEKCLGLPKVLSSNYGFLFFLKKDMFFA